MVKKIQKSGATSASGADFAGTVKESAQQIWLAGLGAFSKAQAEGGKVFETLVKQGKDLQRKTQSAAEGKLSEATDRMSSMANEISSKAAGQWDKLESIFENRVAKALNKLGVPSAKDISALTDRIDALNKSVQELGAKKPAAKRRATGGTAAKKVTAKPASKPAAKRAPRKSA